MSDELQKSQCRDGGTDTEPTFCRVRMYRSYAQDTSFSKPKIAQ